MIGDNKESWQINRIRDLICRKWTLVIIKEIETRGKSRFKDLESYLEGVSPTTLTLTLKKLEYEKIIQKDVFNEVPPRVEYSLSEQGKQFLKLIKPLEKWMASK